MNRVLLISPDRGSGFKLIFFRNRELVMGNWRSGIGRRNGLLVFFYFVITNYQVPITNYPLPITNYQV
ncbi:hypothetical protein [Microcoleus sp. CAWBG58]|uniref:hypothetical protein n=1 Tax=Microcoleus sp. CAWBG58 TaxID=2841651 RepID=UPI0025D10E7E|nr:hypothetical protein [Microcoleus sp. CAWBG58]